MTKWTINTSRVRDPSWWHWKLTIPALAASLTGHPVAIWAAIVLCAGMTVYYLARLRAVRPFPVQIRLGYLVLLLMGLLPQLAWIHWIQLAGTSAMVMVGYCPMERMLLLCTWNRTTSLTPALALDIFLRRPPAGGLLAPAQTASAAGACSLG